YSGYCATNRPHITSLMTRPSLPIQLTCSLGVLFVIAFAFAKHAISSRELGLCFVLYIVGLSIVNVYRLRLRRSDMKKTMDEVPKGALSDEESLKLAKSI